MMMVKQLLLVIYLFQELVNLLVDQREERYDVLEKIMDEKGMAKEGLQWYMDLRRYGGCKHAGFGLGFDRFLMYLTGMQNIRDVTIPKNSKKFKILKAYSLGFFCV